jgi:hypothetical protein
MLTLQQFCTQYLLNKNSVFSLLLAAVVILILYRITPISVDPVINAVIVKNRVGIRAINQERDVESTREVMIDRLNLLDEGRFRHPKLGNIAIYSDDFFLDVNHTIKVKTAGNYTFTAGSDDGFTLTIDDKLICEHPGDRPFSEQNCQVFLTEGEHRVYVSYFQGFGNSGFTLKYARGDEKPKWFGDDSDDVSF